MEDRSLIFTSDGMIHVNKTYSIQNLSQTVCEAHGHIPHQSICQFLTTHSLEQHSFLIVVSANGVVAAYPTALLLHYLGNNTACKSLAPMNGDKYVAGFLADPESTIMIVRCDGSVTIYHVKELPMYVEVPQAGEWDAILPNAPQSYAGAEIVAASVLDSASSVLIVTSKGFAKKIPATEFYKEESGIFLDTPVQCIEPNEATGNIVCGGELPNGSGLEMISTKGRSFWIDSDLLPHRSSCAPPILVYSLLDGEYVDHLLLHT